FASHGSLFLVSSGFGQCNRCHFGRDLSQRLDRCLAQRAVHKFLVIKADAATVTADAGTHSKTAAFLSGRGGSSLDDFPIRGIDEPPIDAHIRGGLTDSESAQST